MKVAQSWAVTSSSCMLEDCLISWNKFIKSASEKWLRVLKLVALGPSLTFGNSSLTSLKSPKL